MLWHRFKYYYFKSPQFCIGAAASINLGYTASSVICLAIYYSSHENIAKGANSIIWLLRYLCFFPWGGGAGGHQAVLFEVHVLSKRKWALESGGLYSHGYFSIQISNTHYDDNKTKSIEGSSLSKRSGLWGIKVKPFEFNRCSCLGAVTQKLSRLAIIRYLKEHTLKISVKSVQWFMKNCGQKILVQSDAQLDTLRKIPGKFQLNPSCCLGGVVVTRILY